MKKRYFEPQIDVVTIETRGILCGSSLGLGGSAKDGGIKSADSREFEWDDEYEY